MEKKPNIIRPWLKASGRTSEGVAAQLEISRDTLSRYARGRYPIPRTTAIAIEHISGGAVTLADWGLV